MKKEEELSKEFIQTEQPKPISNRIFNFLEKYRNFKYNFENTKDKDIKSGKILLKGQNNMFGKQLINEKEVDSNKKLNYDFH